MTDGKYEKHKKQIEKLRKIVSSLSFSLFRREIKTVDKKP